MKVPRSDSLFHFCNQLEKVKSILEKGFIPYYCLEDFTWIQDQDQKEIFIGYPMVCFCDIPISRIEEHIGFYGNYGIGMARDWGINKKLNPVIYCHNKSILSESLRNIISSLSALEYSQRTTNNLEHVKKLFGILAFAKPIEGITHSSRTERTKKFYLENEWRYVPPNFKNRIPVTKEMYEKNKNNLRAKSEENSLNFKLNDIRHIFVETDDDIADLIDFIHSKKFHDCPSKALKILTSRITSIEYLKKDL